MTKRFKLIGDSNLEVLMQHQLELPIYDFNNKKKRLSLNATLNLLNSLYEENEELNSIKKFADRNGICIFNIDEAFRRCWQDNAKLVKENEELKKRNNNQYNQLSELWQIIEEENWEKLIAMKKQLKEDEERLQQEWKCYDD